MCPDDETPSRPASKVTDGARDDDRKQPVLELIDVEKHFGGVTAVANASLEVFAGEVVALVGNNGAGKSTLMRMVSGVHPPDSGEMRFLGQPIRLRSPHDARRQGIETVPQELALAQYLDVAANIFLGRELTFGRGPLAPLNRRRMRRRASELVEGFGVHIPSMKSRVEDLSGGQQQGIAIGRAMAWGSKLVALDEPTAALGVYETRQVEDAIRRLAEQGIAVILVSHQVDQVFRVADRVYVLLHGQMAGCRHIKQSTPDDIVSLITGSQGDKSSAQP